MESHFINAVDVTFKENSMIVDQNKDYIWERIYSYSKN